ncbi:hypothetical protein EVAR_62318_1 [Eumeta japonica]|uniref:Uncharacterized protein n=1 Tax=Eumeta variegata TaxID=151549 RepID=A0A4C1ZGR9_EUMVA|nr:hypothetical protein EVAR_62318_1 [Eumeta japonica]
MSSLLLFGLGSGLSGGGGGCVYLCASYLYSYHRSSAGRGRIDKDIKRLTGTPPAQSAPYRRAHTAAATATAGDIKGGFSLCRNCCARDSRG